MLGERAEAILNNKVVSNTNSTELGLKIHKTSVKGKQNLQEDSLKKIEDELRDGFRP